MMYIPTDINMVLQILIAAVLFLGVFFIKKHRRSPHGYLMFIVVTLSVPSVGLVMAPSALRIISGASLSPFEMLVLAHSFLGAISMVLGIYVLLVWRFRRPEGSCFKVARWMKALAVLWVLSLALGTMMFYELYY